MALRTETYATSVELTLGGFLFSILVLDWARPMMRPSAHASLAWGLHVGVACLFGLMGVLLVSIPACRRPVVAIPFTLVVGPLLGAGAAFAVEKLYPAVFRDDAAHGALVGLAVAPFVACTFLRRQPRSERRFEEAACQRASWAVMLLALAAAQIPVAMTEVMWGLEEQLRRRPDSSSAVGLLAVVALFGIVVADARLNRSLRRAVEDDAPLAGEQVEIELYRHVRAKGLVNLGLAIFAAFVVLTAQQIGGPAYALYWPFGIEAWD